MRPDLYRLFTDRMLQIDALTATIEERQTRMQRIEQSITAARVRNATNALTSTVSLYAKQDNWQPELEKLVNSIGQKFSAAFDRASFPCRLPCAA